MKWRGTWLIKLLMARAVSNENVRAFCEKRLGVPVDVGAVINGTNDFVLKIFYTIFEPDMGIIRKGGHPAPTHEWILKRLVDGLGMRFPREMIHLGNMAVARQRELSGNGGSRESEHLITTRALRLAFDSVSAYRCETYLNAEFPHLSSHFDVFRGKESTVFGREELLKAFERLDPHGEDAIRMIHDVGLLSPLGKNVDSALKYEIPLLYRSGLGIVERKARRKRHRQKAMEERKQVRSSEAPKREVPADDVNIPAPQFR
jgi:hypothetical protein